MGKFNRVVAAVLGTFFSISGAADSWADPRQPKSLDDSFQAALLRSETIGVQTELLNQTEEHYKQAIGGVLPSISAFGSQTLQEVPGNPTSAAFFPPAQPLLKISASQPIFRGFREFAGIQASSDLVGAQLEARRAAAVQLYKDVVLSFYTVLSLEQDMRDLSEEIHFYDKRIADLNERKRIGRSRLSEVLSAQSSLAGVKGQLEADRGALAAAREVYAFLTGFESSTPLEPVVGHPFSASTRSLDAELARVDFRPDVRAEMNKLKSAVEGIRIAKGAHLPSVDLGGNYYMMRQGFASDITWDVTLSISLPIYAGGTISSKVVESESLERQESLLLTQVQRQAKEEISSLHAQVDADVAQLKALREGAALAEKNYAAQNRDYALGLVTNLDVLTAITLYQESHRSFDRAQFTYMVDRARLEAALFHKPVLVGDRWETKR